MNIELNLALLFTVSILPDFDIVLFRFIAHRGPLHSLLFSLVVCLPFFVVYRKKAIPYFFALLSHSLVGDIFSGGVQLFWPFSTDWIFISIFSSTGIVSVGMELVIFVATTVVMIINKDFQRLLFNKTSWVYWVFPFGAVIGPIFFTFGQNNQLPLLLVAPGLLYIALFFYSMICTNNKNDKKKHKI